MQKILVQIKKKRCLRRKGEKVKKWINKCERNKVKINRIKKVLKNIEKKKENRESHSEMGG